MMLEGRSGIITGALGGIGRELVQAFHGAGARVALFDLDGDEARQRADQLGEGAIGIGVDITDQEQVEGAVGEAATVFGSLDFLVNNAGVRFEAPFLDHTVQQWQHTLDVNLTGTFLCAQAAARRMVANRSGKIVNIASIAAESAFRNRAAYVASKAAILGLTRAIAWELGPQGIHCNAIAPGIIETPLTRHYFEDEARTRLIRESSGLMRWGKPSDVTGPAIFLCSPASDFVQGTTLVADGGWLAGKGY